MTQLQARPHSAELPERRDGVARSRRVVSADHARVVRAEAGRANVQDRRRRSRRQSSCRPRYTGGDPGDRGGRRPEHSHLVGRGRVQRRRRRRHHRDRRRRRLQRPVPQPQRSRDQLKSGYSQCKVRKSGCRISHLRFSTILCDAIAAYAYGVAYIDTCCSTQKVCQSQHMLHPLQYAMIDVTCVGDVNRKWNVVKISCEN